MEYTVPASIEDALLDLKGLGEIIIASEWRRAALVWAFTYEGTNQNDACSDVSKRSVSQFAALKVPGLGSRNSVAKYRKAWQAAIDDGLAEAIQPGDLIHIPDAEWLDYFQTRQMPPIPKPTPKGESINVEPIEWDDDGWDVEDVATDRKMQIYTDRMFLAIEDLEKVGAEGMMIQRLADDLVNLARDTNKVRGMYRLMDAITEVASWFKTKRRELT